MIQGFSSNAEKRGNYNIENAGAVLLTPFLNHLFKNSGWEKEDEIDHPSSAVLAIHYAVTGHSKPEKNDLLLPGIMCGIRMGFFIDSEIKLMQEEEQGVSEIIRSAIQQWKVLENTSIQGFQESFLKRRGLLTPQGNNWLLKVEHSAVDILLDSLPWGISLIKLPWMRGILRTEWR